MIGEGGDALDGEHLNHIADPFGIEPQAMDAHRPSLDDMIQRLQRDQDNRIARAGGEPLASPPPVGSPPPFLSPRSTRSSQGKQ